jgi:leucyl aminopeptidase
MLVGLGKKKKYDLDVLRKSIASAARKTRELNIKTLSVFLGENLKVDKRFDRTARALVEGTVLGLYKYRDFKKMKKDEGEIKSLEIVVEESKIRRAVGKGAREGQAISESVSYVRDLNNKPGNVATPDYLARQARSISRKYGLGCKILGEKDLEKLKMGAILAVGTGSSLPSRLILLHHKGGGASGEKIVLVGKGITFDSGGLSLKPGPDMDRMKYDKSGGVVVMGVLMAAARLGIPINVTGIIPAVENLPGGSAYRPGDILKTYSGKTVEVLNTDAEGRLILADAIAYGLKLKPAAMIDIATLTGACVIALGNHAAGLMGNDQDVIDELKEAGERSGERLWQLPMWDEYGESLKSDVADIKNVGDRGGSAIAAGMFLKAFVKDTPWAHLDIAGTAWSTKGSPYIPRGPSGMGVRLLLDFLEKRASRAKRTGKKGRGS